MNLKKVKARGFIGFKNGMGVDEIEIDMSNMSGLIAIAGNNGMGKTTLLEVCSPYRTMASRKGKLNDHVFLRDSFKEVTFDMDGTEYRCLVKIDSGSSRSEGFAWKNGEPMVNGKVSEYDAYITDLLGSQNLFYSSVFCAQNSQKLSDMRPGEIKELFIEFLQIKKYEEWEQTAKLVGSNLAGKESGLKDQIERFLKSLQEVGDPEKDVEVLRQSVYATERDIVEYNTQIDSLRDDVDKANIEHEKGRANIEKRGRLYADMDTANKKMADENIAFNSKVREIKGRINKINSEISILPTFTPESIDRMNRASEERETIRAMFTQKKNHLEDISNAVAKSRESLKKAEAEQGAIMQELSEKQRAAREEEIKAAEAVRLIQNGLSEKRSELEKVARDAVLLALKNDLAMCEKQVENLHGIDPACTSTVCRFITSANESKARIDDLKKQIAERTADLDRAKTELEWSINVDLEAIQTTESFNKGKQGGYKAAISFIESRLAVINETISNLRNDIGIMESEFNDVTKEVDELNSKDAELSRLESMKNEIAIAEVRIGELNKSKAQAETDLSTATAEHNDRVAAINADLASISNEIVTLNEIITRIESVDIQSLKSRLISCETYRNDLVNKRAKTLAEIDMAIERAEEARKSRDILGNLEMKAISIRKEISDWNYIQYGCSKKGLQVLEIDGVTPLITRDANDILHKSFGGEFTIKIITKDEETGAEVFQIRVIKKDGSEVLIENLSGGQKVWNLKALRLAMTLISKEKSGKHLQTAFADEEDGALDEEKASMFIKLYRAFMGVGDFEKCLFISHRADVIAQADHTITLSKKGIEVD